MFILWILVSIAAAVLLWFGFFSLIDFFSGRSRYQKQFTAGSAPQDPPEGFYRGAAHLLGDSRVPWLGKSFDGARGKGFNIFTPQGASLLKIVSPFYKLFSVNGEGNTNAYYFKTYAGAGLKDAGTKVIKLDYDSPENPFFIRIILDEIVEIAPEQFLGKVHVKFFPGIYSTVGYFGLKK